MLLLYIINTNIIITLYMHLLLCCGEFHHLLDLIIIWKTIFVCFVVEKKYSAPFSKNSLITFTLPVKKLFFGYNHVRFNTGSTIPKAV